MVNARAWIDAQIRWSRGFDALLPAEYTVDGNRDFVVDVVPRHIRRGMRVYDVGGGKNPVISRETKEALELTVVGLDIAGRELAAAPPGSYDETICADIARYGGTGDADLVICQAVLEHTGDTCAALRSIARLLKPGGKALIFAPSRNAVYARLNLMLPESVKRWMISRIYPEMSRDHGFPAFYDQCTPARLTKIARVLGLAAEDCRLYFHSSYFQFLFPVYLVWRLWVLLFHRFAGDEAAETFTFVFRKEDQRPAPKVLFGMNSLFAIRHLAGEMLSFVRRKGYEVIVAAPSVGHGASFLSELKARFYSVDIQREMSPFADLRALCQLWRVVRTTRPDITNMSTPKMGLLGGLAACAAGVPFRIYTLRGLRYETTRSWKRAVLIAAEKLACACAHQVIAISRSVREKAIHDGLASHGKIITLGQRVSEGIRIQPAHRFIESGRGDMRRRMSIPDGAFVLGFVGRLTRDKGIGELVACMQILERQGRDVHLVIAGDFESGDPVDPETAEWIRSHPRAHWTGYVSDPYPYYGIMDVFLFPTHREGLGKVLLEAAAAGKPVVSTRTTGVIDAVQDGVTGLLVPAGDAEALAVAVAAILDDPEMAARMGAAGRKLVQEHYDNTIYLERLGAMFDALTNRRRSSLETCPEMRG